TATGTSFALPLPMPMRPSPSPTTVSAAKPRMRPPFTTFVTRLMEIIFSRRPSPRSSCCCGWGDPERCCAIDPFPKTVSSLKTISSLNLSNSSELEAALAGCVGQRLHAAMEPETRAVECHRVDTERLRLLGDALADQRRGRLVAAGFQVLANVRFQR